MHRLYALLVKLSPLLLQRYVSVVHTDLSTPLRPV